MKSALREGVFVETLSLHEGGAQEKEDLAVLTDLGEPRGDLVEQKVVASRMIWQERESLAPTQHCQME